MKKLMILLRLGRLELFGLNKMLHDPTRRHRAKWLIALLVLGALAIVGVVGVYCFGIATGMQWLGILEAYPVLMTSLAALTAFMTTIYKAPDTLFRTRDFDQVLSLPISARTVAAARMLKLFEMNLLFTLLIMLPSGFAYAWFAHPGAGFYVAYILAMLVTPMVPVVLSAMLGVLITFAGASLKHMRYAGLFLSFVALLGIMFGSSYISMASIDVSQIIHLSRMLIDVFSRIYPLAGLYMSGVVLGDVGALIAFVSLSIATFALSVWLFGRFFVKLNTFLSARHVRTKFVLQPQKERGVQHALLAREWRRYLSCNSYVLNSAFGLIVSLIGVIALAVMLPRELLNSMFSMVGKKIIILAIVPFLLAWLLSIGPTTGCSISLEGKNLWISKGLPISAYSWLMAKLQLNLQLMLPFAVVDALVLAFAFNIRGLPLLLLFLLPIVTGVFMALLGLIVNCKIYNFDWTNETKVVKRSWGTSIPMFISMVVLPLGAYLTFKVSAMEHMLVPLLFAFALLVADIVLWLQIRAKAEKWVARM